MILLLDECLPVRFGRLLVGHDVRTVGQMGWLGLSNGKLLNAADSLIDVFITVDQNLVHQQRLDGYRLSVIVLPTRSNKIEDLSPLANAILAALPVMAPGQVLTLGSQGPTSQA